MAVCYLWVSSIFVLSLFPNKTVVTGKRIYYTKIIRMKGSFELNKKRERERESERNDNNNQPNQSKIFIEDLWIALI